MVVLEPMNSETALLNNKPNTLHRASRERDNSRMINCQVLEMAVIHRVDLHPERSVKCQVKEVNRAMITSMSQHYRMVQTINAKYPKYQLGKK